MLHLVCNMSGVGEIVEAFVGGKQGLCCTKGVSGFIHESSMIAGRMSRPTPPIYKTRNWLACNEALKRRCSLAIWSDPDMSWRPRRRPSAAVSRPTAIPLSRHA